MVYLLYGEDSYLKNNYLNKLKKQWEMKCFYYHT